MGLTKIGRFLSDILNIQDVDDRTPQEKVKMDVELYMKTGLSMNALDNMSFKEVINFKRKNGRK